MSYASRVRGTSSPTKPTPGAKFIAGLSGLQVTLELVSGECYQGILLQKSSLNTYWLGQVQLLSKEPDSTDSNRFEDELSFDAGQVSCMRLHSESKGDREELHAAFKTDAEIRSKKSEKPMRNLEKWDGGDDGGTSMSLDQEAKMRPEDRGWDQFSVNQKLFGYQSSYAEENYTTSLDRQSEFYRQNEPKARKVAADIENEVSENLHIAEERGHQISHDVDEESRYSTVLDRPKSKSPDIYRPPALRNKSPEQDRTARPGSSASNNSNERDASPVKSVSPVKNTSPMKSPALENTSPVKASVPANHENQVNSPQEAESANGHQDEDEEKQFESGSDDNSKKFQFNAGAKEFVPTTLPGLYFTDGSYMPVVETPSPLMPPIGMYPAYSFNPYYPQYSPMGYVNQPMMFSAPGNYQSYQAQPSHNPNRSRPQSRSAKPSQTKQQSNTTEPNADN